ncbi:MAG: peptidylprolyl isomerase [Bacilli bacterium]|nr:peptidylprolyl isomerase [Bacilli bacterium]
MRKYVKYIVIVLVILFFVVGILVSDNSNKRVEISIKDYGKMVVELYRNAAPITVDNFLNLVNSEFYNNLTMHRIIDGFMIQGGDPDADGTGGSSKKIKGEFSSNGVNNNLSHVRGVISMARSNDPNSASSQFFIMHKDNTSLDGNYAAFGKVINGIEVVDKIVDAVSDLGDDNGLIPKENQPIIEYIKVIE